MRAPASTLTAEQEELLTLRDRVFELEEENAALKRCLESQPMFPLGWQLTRTEAKLLSSFMNARGGFCSEERLRLALYGFGPERSSNVIRVQLSRMRRKIIRHGVEIVCRRGDGWALPERARDVVAAAMKAAMPT